MAISRLFHVLVVQGSLIVGACDAATPDDDEEGSGKGTEGGTTEGGSDSDVSSDSGDSSGTSTSTSEATGSPETTGAESDSEESDTQGSGEATSEDTQGDTSDPDLDCSEAPDPTDPCGCPCCWAMTDENGDPCLNDDDVCCAGFSEACTPV
jgi:hypothetical protein